MKYLFALSFFILTSCINNNETSKNTFKSTDSNEIESIKKMLTDQQKCWNNGDIDGFMEGYWNSEELIFTSAKHMPAYGWQNTLERYKNSYPTKESMGELKFEFLNVKINSDSTTAQLKGCWELIRKEDNPKGEFWLDLKKFNDNWLIIKDSTTSLY
jgi:ketosteroid isomerase-like protein